MWIRSQGPGMHPLSIHTGPRSPPVPLGHVCDRDQLSAPCGPSPTQPNPHIHTDITAAPHTGYQDEGRSKDGESIYAHLYRRGLQPEYRLLWV